MSIGNSGRIVIEVEPEAKRRLYAALALDGLTLKDWFLKNAEKYLTEGNQLSLSFSRMKSDEVLDETSEQNKSPSSRS